MTPETKMQIRASWAAIAGKEDAFAWAFYSDLFERLPAALGYFAHTTMAQQRERFHQMLAVLVGAIDEPASLREDLRALAKRHVGYGISMHDYAPAGESLIRAFQATLGPDFTPAMRTAWEDLYRFVVGAMRPEHPEWEGPR